MSAEFAGIEPLRRVKKYSGGIVATAVLAVALGVTLDFTRWNQLCEPSKCHWTARSGAIVIICGTYLAFRAAKVLITVVGGVAKTNVTPSLQYGVLSFLLIAGGTLLWGFGDLIAPL
jgi:hypothetical protein